MLLRQCGSVYYRRCMGYTARNDEIRDNVARMRREWEAATRRIGDRPPL
jgi:hypothetical protein